MSNEVVVLNGASHYGIESTISFESSLFKCGDISFQLKDTIRNKDVIIIQGFSLPNTHLMELMICIDSCRRSGANKITLIIPHLPYSRQDKRHSGGQPVSVKVVLDMLKSVNINRLITFDLHANSITGMLPNNIVFDHIQMSAFWEYHLSRVWGDMRDVCFVAPDAGAIKRTNGLSTQCESGDVCFINKIREKAGIVKDMTVIGDVRGKNCILTDDMCDSGGTLIKAKDVLYNAGASDVKCVVTHGILSTGSYTTIKEGGLDIMVSDSCLVPLVDKNGVGVPDSIMVTPLKNFMLEIINRVQNNIMMGTLFRGWGE
jgi:ribose-phosphate pyrophosphokinase